MKANRILLLCSAVALPQLAMADLPSPESLGTVSAILTFCAQMDPHDAKSFQQEWKSVVGGTTDAKLDSAENGGAYKHSFDTITAELKKLSGPSVASACAVGAASWRGDSVATSGKGDGDGSSGKGSGGSTSGKGDGGSTSGKGDGDGASGKGNGGSTAGKGDGGSTLGKIEPKFGKDERDASRGQNKGTDTLMKDRY